MSMWLTGWLSSKKKATSSTDSQRLRWASRESSSYYKGMLPVHRAVCPRTGILSHAVPGNGYVPGQGFCPMLCLAMAINVLGQGFCSRTVFVPCCAWQWLCSRTEILSHAMPGNVYQCLCPWATKPVVFHQTLQVWPGRHFCILLCLITGIRINVQLFGLKSLSLPGRWTACLGWWSCPRWCPAHRTPWTACRSARRGNRQTTGGRLGGPTHTAPSADTVPEQVMKRW